MKKLLLTLILFVVSSSAMAEWVEVGSNIQELFGDKFVHTAYADPASIQKVGSIIKIQIFISKNLAKPQASIVGWQAEFECKKALSRSIPHDWAPVIPDSIDEKLLNFACGKFLLGDAIIDNNRQWSFTADMNFDGVVTISDSWLWIKWLFFFPSDYIISVFIKKPSDIAIFLELSPTSYGGWGSGVLSIFTWYFLFGTLFSFIDYFNSSKKKTDE